MRELLNTLYVQTEGTVVHLEGDAVLARGAEGTVARAPLLRFEAIVLIGRVSATTALVQRCAADGRDIVWLMRAGRFAGRLQGPMSGSVLLRRAQWASYNDERRRADIARVIVAGKIQNTVRLGRNFARLSRDPDAASAIRDNVASMVEALPQLAAAENLNLIRGLEGQVSRHGFDNVRRALLGELPFGVRSRRPPTDPVNALLSFVYTLARSRVGAACESIGLDPQVGYLHSLRPGRPALALDLLEEYRADIDRFVVTLCNRKQITARHFEHLPGHAISLTEVGRRETLAAWYERLTQPVAHRVLGQQVPWGLLPQVQATLLARHLRGDLDHYLPYVTRIE